MDNKQFILLIGKLIGLLGVTLFAALLLGIITVCFYYFPGQRVKNDRLEAANAPADTKIGETTRAARDGIHLPTGFVVDQGYDLVIANCTGCHSSQLVVQNRASREGWKNMIVWMQSTQNLWDLGEQEEEILNYLAKHYAPTEQGRRKPLVGVEWYVLE